MCIGLEVERSEACIADPSLLKVKKIIPIFFSAEAFQDQAIFALKADPNAHGGFNNGKQPVQLPEGGGLAMGLGREAVNAVLPLYLFKEHWDIARRRAPGLFGLMCTADVMGYAASQQFLVPFKLLLRTIYDVQQSPTEMHKKIQVLILDTCKAIVQGNEEFRKGLIKLVADFQAGAEFRTHELIPNIQIFMAQLYVLTKIEGIEEQFKITKQQLQTIFRFAFEEEFRRNLARTVAKEALTDDQCLDLLFPDHKEFVDQVIQAKQTDINTEVMSQLMSGVDQAMAPFTEMANQFLKAEKDGVDIKAEHLQKADVSMKDQNEEVKQGEKPWQPVAAATATVQEESKGEAASPLKTLNMDDVMAKGVEKVNQLPWRAQLLAADGALHKTLIADVKTNFT